MSAHTLAVFCSLIIAMAPAAALAASQRKAAEVEAADQRFNRALEGADVAALRELIADSYVFTDPGGRLSNKHDIIEGFASGRIRIQSQTTQDVRIDLYADTAVETGLLTSVAVRDGHNTSGRFRFTRIWVKQSGRWRTVAFQETAPQTTPPAVR